MILVTCKEEYRNIHNFIYSKLDHYVESIEYIDNEYDEVIIKTIRKGCSLKKYYRSTKISFYNIEGYLHNPIGPAEIFIYPNGEAHCIKYYMNGLLHREDDPAVIQYFMTEMLKEYWKNGKRRFFESQPL